MVNEIIWTEIQSKNVHFLSGGIFKQIRYVVCGDILKKISLWNTALWFWIADPTNILSEILSGNFTKRDQ